MEFIVGEKSHKIVMTSEEYIYMLRLANFVSNHEGYKYLFNNMYVILPKEVELDEASLLEIEMEKVRRKDVKEMLKTRTKSS